MDQTSNNQTYLLESNKDSPRTPAPVAYPPSSNIKWFVKPFTCGHTSFLLLRAMITTEG